MGRGRNGAGRGRGGRPGVRAGRSSAVAGIPAAPATAEEIRAANAPPQPRESLLSNTEVTDADYGIGKNYTFETASGQRVRMLITSGGGYSSIAFDVNGILDRATMPKAEANAVSMRLMQIMREDVKSKPDGHVYTVTAHRGDGYSTQRARAYEVVGFSRPLYGRVGQEQFGVVKNGKLIPDRQRLISEEGTMGSASYDRSWAAQVRDMRATRNVERAR